jgi:ferrous iron transport protein A
MLLTDLNRGQKGIVKRVVADSELKQRLFSFGLVRGAEVELVDCGLKKSTVEIKVGNTLLALREGEARSIEVEEIR